MQCEAVGHAAVIDCVHHTAELELPTGLRVNLSTDGAPPWHGNPKQLQRSWPELRVQYHPALYARLHKAGTDSRAAGLCGGRGIASSVLADNDVATAEVRRLLKLSSWTAESKDEQRRDSMCTCAHGHSGAQCAPLTWHASNCLNSCSGTGQCVAGTCVCDAGTHGIDCSSSFATSAGRASAEARIGAASPRVYVYELPPRFTTWLAVSRLEANGCGKAGPGAKDGPCWWQLTDPMYSADTKLLNRLLASPHRTLQPEKADYFYVPLMLSLGFVSHRFGIYMPSAPGARLISAAIDHVRMTYPFWNRTDGRDHLMPFTGDDGAAWLRGRLPILEHATFLTHWGMTCNDERLRQRGQARQHCVQGQLGFRAHRAGQDVVLPPLHSPHALLPKAVWMRRLDAPSATATPPPASNAAIAPAAAPEPLSPSPLSRAPLAALAPSRAALDDIDAVLRPNRTYRYLLYFVGKVARSKREGDIYSGGVRQRIYEHFNASDDFYLRERPGAKGRDADLAALTSSKFCLAPHGTGFGMRQFDAVLHGCVPLIVKVRWEDDRNNGGVLEQPFAEVLPWNAIAYVELSRADIPNLPKLLADFPIEQHAAMRRAAACAWPRLFWMPLPTARGVEIVDHVLDADGCGAACKAQIQSLEAHDAFSTLMLTLRYRLDARRRRRAESQGALAPTEGAVVREWGDEEVTSTLWAGLETTWASGPRLLRTAPWRTPAVSCERAIEWEEGRAGP